MKNNITSNAERYRRERKQQVEDRREQIITTARILFLKNGIEHTTMQEIADAAHISKMTLYRYFPDRASVAIEVSISTLHQIRTHTLHHIGIDNRKDAQFKDIFLAIIDSYPELEEDYRFMAMFDNLYYENYPTPELEARYKEEVQGVFMDALVRLSTDEAGQEKFAHFITIANMIAAFLQRLALRGELMAEEQRVTAEIQLQLFRKYITEISNDIFHD